MFTGKKNTVRKILAMATAAVIAITGIFAVPAENIVASPRTGNRDVILGRFAIMPFVQEKKIDLTGSGVDIRMTKEKDKAIFDQADRDTIKWLVGMFVQEFLPDEVDEHYGERDIPVYSPKYWFDEEYETLSKILAEAGPAHTDDPELNARRDKAIAFTKRINDNYKTLTELLATEDKELINWLFDGFIVETLTSYNLRMKREGIYNDRFSDALVEKLRKQLNVKFDFDLVPLAEDGSEDERFGIGKTVWDNDTKETIKRGTLDVEKLNYLRMDFGAPDQFYDKILEEIVDGYMAYGNLQVGDQSEFLEKIMNSDENADPYEIWKQGIDASFGGENGAPLLRDFSYISHIMLQDGGDLVSSDDSQHSTSGMRGSATWPGWHCLLEVCDSLGTYAWARYLTPHLGDPYVQTFNLHLNPAVTYIGTGIRADLITNAEFDENGKLKSISKPLFVEDNMNELLKKLERMASFHSKGIYRYKLVESDTAGKTLPGGQKFIENTEEKIVDIKVTSGSSSDDLAPEYFAIYDSVEQANKAYRRNDYSDFDAEKVRTLFTNKLEPKEEEEKKDEPKKEEGEEKKEPPKEELLEKDKPDIKKTIKGSSNFKIQKLSEKFAYRITTSMPKAASSFEVVDEMDEVLEFVDPSNIKVYIDGKALTEAELKSQLSVKGKTLRVKFTDKQLKDYAGKSIWIDFKAKIEDGADLTGYYGVVQNIAYYVLDGEESVKVGAANVELPKYYASNDDEEDQGYDDQSGESEDSASKAKSKSGNGGFVRTGDESRIVIWVIMVIAAVIVLTAVYRRRKHDQK